MRTTYQRPTLSPPPPINSNAIEQHLELCYDLMLEISFLLGGLGAAPERLKELVTGIREARQLCVGIGGLCGQARTRRALRRSVGAEARRIEQEAAETLLLKRRELEQSGLGAEELKRACRRLRQELESMGSSSELQSIQAAQERARAKSQRAREISQSSSKRRPGRHLDCTPEQAIRDKAIELIHIARKEGQLLKMDEAIELAVHDLSGSPEGTTPELGESKKD